LEFNHGFDESLNKHEPKIFDAKYELIKNEKQN
jgi:hypothetical protein